MLLFLAKDNVVLFLLLLLFFVLFKERSSLSPAVTIRYDVVGVQSGLRRWF